MKNPKKIKKQIIFRLAAVLTTVGLLLSAPHIYQSVAPSASEIAKKATLFSAGFVMPEGGLVYLKEQLNNAQEDTSPAAGTPSQPDAASSSVESVPVSSEAAVSSEAPVSSQAPVDPANMLKVKETQIKNTGLNYGSIWVKKQTANKTIDIKTELKRKPDIKIKKNTENPQVLIVHTHTSESYMDSYTGYYSKDFSPRSTDKSKNIVRVADEIIAKLEASGIKTVHATTFHDYPKYNGAYGRAEATIKEYLKKYPSIEVVLDVHRDGMQYDDGTKVKPTAVINGKKAAQVMIISGCDDEGKLDFPDWEYNMRFAVRLQKQMAEKYPGLARPVLFAPFRYNMHMTHGSLLVEFGTDANTLEEALYSAQMFGDVLVDVLDTLTV